MKHRCPVCGRHDFLEYGAYEICPVCGWEDDRAQDEDHNYAGGANPLSVNEARMEYYLLNRKDAAQEVKGCKEAYGLTVRIIRGRYEDIRRTIKLENEGKEELELSVARQEYMDTLNRILQGNDETFSRTVSQQDDKDSEKE